MAVRSTRRLGTVCALAATALVVAGGIESTDAAAPSLAGGRAPAWSPDGTLVAYIGPQFDDANGSAKGLNKLIVMSAVDGSGKRTISSVQNGAAGLNEVRWASSRRIVFDINPDGLLRSVDIGSRRVVALGSVENVALGDPGESFSRSGDGRLVAFDTHPLGSPRTGNLRWRSGSSRRLEDIATCFQSRAISATRSRACRRMAGALSSRAGSPGEAAQSLDPRCSWRRLQVVRCGSSAFQVFGRDGLRTAGGSHSWAGETTRTGAWR